MNKIFLFFFFVILFPIGASSAIGDYISYTHEGVRILFSVTGETTNMQKYPGTVSVGKSTGSSYTVSIPKETTGIVKIPSQIVYKNNKYNVTGISNYAFKDCESVEQLEIPKSVTTIGKGAFNNCSSLTSVEIPESVTDIGEAAFSGCSSLVSVGLPKSVYNLRTQMFSDCVNLKKVDMASIFSVGEGAFYNCEGLEVITLNAKLIYKEAFYGCKSLKTVKFKSACTLEYDAFYGCTSLKNIYSYSEQPYESRKFADIFEGIPADAALYVPYGMISQYKEKEPWQSFSKIRIIPPQIGETFMSNLPTKEDSISVRFKVLNDTLMEVCVDSINDKLLHEKMIERVVIPSSFIDYEDILFQIVGIDSSAFEGASIRSVHLSDNIRFVNRNAFKNCSQLAAINIPKNIDKIEENVFLGCENLDSISVSWRRVQDIKSFQVFNDVYSQAKLYIPAGTYNLYSEHDIWGNFSQIIEGGPISLGDVKSVPGSCANLNVNLRTTEEMAGFQFKLTLPEGVSVSEGDENLDVSVTDRTEGFTVVGNKDPDSENSYLFAALSLDGEAIKGHDGTILNIKLDIAKDLGVGDYEMTIEDVHMSTTSIETFSPMAVTSDLSIINEFDLIYMIDGVEYKRVSVIAGDSVMVENVPTKEGHTFSGWDEVPIIMPNHELVISGTFIPNKYQITYVLDENVFLVDSVSYGEYILLPEVPTKDYFSFDGWNEVPETMPAHDLTLAGSYTLMLEMGDVNGDGRISIVDITILTNRVLRKENEIFIELTADLNGDGRISVIDITMITNKILEK